MRNSIFPLSPMDGCLCRPMTGGSICTCSMNNSIAIALDQRDKQKEALAAWHGLSMSILSAANVAARRCLRGDDWCIKWPKTFGGDQRSGDPWRWISSGGTKISLEKNHDERHP